jgi:hypothetical protein
VAEKKLEDGIEFVDHLHYATEVERFVYGWSIVVILAIRFRRQVRKVISALLRSVVILCQITTLLLPDDSVEWIEIKKVRLFLCCSRCFKLFKLNLYLYLRYARL